MSSAPQPPRRFRFGSRRDLWTTVVPIVLIIAGAFVVTARYIRPAPPMHITLATGSDEGGAKYNAKRYQEFLKKQGVTLELKASSGTAESVHMLADASADAAFVLGGTAPADGASVVSLGSLSYSPLWVFYRGDTIDDFGELKGKRIAVGPADSGTFAIARQLLAANGADQAPTELLTLERKDSMDQLKAGQIDAAFLISPADSPLIQKFAATPGIRLMSVARADAYSRRFQFLTKLVVPRGVFNLQNDVPPQDVTVVAPTANLVVRRDLHPALSYLLLRAATDIHSRAGLLDRAGEFPAPLESGFTLSDEARRYYRTGAPLLQRYLPFWAANLVDRLWVMLVPIIAVMVPLGRLIPPLYRWRVRSRIYRWYASLKEVELQLSERSNRADLEEMLRRLDAIENAVNHIQTPLSYSEELYGFRQNLDLVRRRIVQHLARTTTPQQASV